VVEFILDVQATQPRVGTDWANLGAFQLVYALSGCLVVEALARIDPAAQPNRYTVKHIFCSPVEMMIALRAMKYKILLACVHLYVNFAHAGDHILSKRK
jgi:hypothetical protein